MTGLLATILRRKSDPDLHEMIDDEYDVLAEDRNKIYSEIKSNSHEWAISILSWLPLAMYHSQTPLGIIIMFN